MISQWFSHEWVPPHEDALAKQPYAVRLWVDYLDAVDDHLLVDDNNSLDQIAIAARDWIGRRAVAHLPRSYKLWKRHWEFVLKQNNKNGTAASSSALEVRSLFERCLLTLSAYPRVWMVYLEWLLQNDANNCVIDYTFLRRTINRAFQSVTVAQHQKLWDVVVPPLLELEYKSSRDSEDDNEDDGSKQHSEEEEEEDPNHRTSALQWLPWESANRLLKRYCQFNAAFTSEYAAWCERHGRWGAAATAYQELLNNTNSASSASEQHWQSFCELVAQHSQDCERAGIPWEAILQTALQQQRTQPEKPETAEGAIASAAASSRNNNTMLGLLYSWLASAWIQRGSFDWARTVYEEGLRTVRTVRDFSVLYAAYLQLEEGLLTAVTDSMEEDEEDEEDVMDTEAEGTDSAAPQEDWDLLLADTTTATAVTNNNAQSKLAEMELAMARAEHLTARRPLLLNAVKLRQNPNDCAEWIERANLYCQANQPRQAAAALEEALQTVQSGGGGGGATTQSLSQVVIRLAQVYEDSMHDVTAARDLLDRVCRQRSTALGFGKTEELAECWATWVELELKHEAWDEALSLARQSVAQDSRRGQRGGRRLHLTKSLRLWDLLLDLEESLGTVQTTKDAYNRALETKVATVQHVLNFGVFLTEQKYFEEALTAYERGVELFPFPHAGAKLLWKAYLEAFLKRYKGTKVERARNLFQRCLEDCPAEECVEFFMMNGEFEEEFGLTKRALSVYRAMAEKVPMAEKYNAYQLFIAKTTKYLGLAATRDIYQEAIEKLSKDAASAVKMCRDFAKMEIGLQQIERARAIYTYGAQSADPRRMPEYWKDWNDFEIANGNEETFREMLRIKRSTEAAFSTINYNAAGMSDKVENFSNEEAMKMVAGGEGIDLEDSSRSAISGFVSSKRTSAAANLQDVEERVAKLRKATSGAAATQESVMVNQENEGNASSDDDEIDIDDIDAEIEEAAAEGEEAAHQDKEIHDVSTKVVPDAVFGGLAAQKAK